MSIYFHRIRFKTGGISILPSFKNKSKNSKVMKWESTKVRLPDKDGLYLIVHNSPAGSGRHEMYFKIEDKKWYWQPNPYSVCGDGFITGWLDESPSPSIEELAQKLRAANPFIGDIESIEDKRIGWNECIQKLLQLSKQQTNE